jgi:hypothetical protein
MVIMIRQIAISICKMLTSFFVIRTTLWSDSISLDIRDGDTELQLKGLPNSVGQE